MAGRNSRGIRSGTTDRRPARATCERRYAWTRSSTADVALPDTDVSYVSFLWSRSWSRSGRVSLSPAQSLLQCCGSPFTELIHSLACSTEVRERTASQ